MVVDAFSRRVVGWVMDNHLRSELVLQALEMACGERRPSEVVHHSDQGTQYTSIAFGKHCEEMGVRPSMGSIGDCLDAIAESFFATLKCELLDRRRFTTQAEAAIAVFDFIEGLYDPQRRHSSIWLPLPGAVREAPCCMRLTRHVLNRPSKRANSTLRIRTLRSTS